MSTSLSTSASAGLGDLRAGPHGHWSAIESADPEQIRELQSAALGAQLRSVLARSEFYRHKFAATGALIEDVKTVDDLCELPFTHKEELLRSQTEHPPLGGHSGVTMAEVERVHASSGTTGKPSYIGVTATDAQRWREAVARAYYAQGVRSGSVVTMGFGIGFFVGGIPVQQALAAIGATAIPVGVGATERLIEASTDLGADILTCTPTYAAHLAEHLARRSIDPRSLGFERILVGAEPGGGIPAVRIALESAWGAKVTESLGNGDIVPIHSGECEAGDGNHFLVPDMAVLEVIEPDTQKVVDFSSRAESSGELVLTHLDRQCNALIRFRTRDHVSVRTDPCRCGRTGPRLVCIGRTDDMLIVRGVNVWPTAVADVVNSFRPRLNGRFRIALDRPGHHHDPPLLIVAETTGAGASTAAGLQPAQVEAALRDRLIVTCKVDFVAEATFPRTHTKEQLLWRRDLEPNPAKART